MNDKRIFVDSNIILYLFTDDERRKKIAATLFSKEYIISTQIVNENVNVCLKKLKLSKEIAYAHGRDMLNSLTVINIHPSTIKTAFDLSVKYGYGYWDSLVISAALENDCELLFTEDMHEGQLIEGKLKIKNPFRE